MVFWPRQRLLRDEDYSGLLTIRLTIAASRELPVLGTFLRLTFPRAGSHAMRRPFSGPVPMPKEQQRVRQAAEL